MNSATLFLLAGTVTAQSQKFPPLSKGVNMGAGVPIVKADIPAGCSNLQILVGKHPRLNVLSSSY